MQLQDASLLKKLKSMQTDTVVEIPKWQKDIVAKAVRKNNLDFLTCNCTFLRRCKKHQIARYYQLFAPRIKAQLLRQETQFISAHCLN